MVYVLLVLYYCINVCIVLRPVTAESANLLFFVSTTSFDFIHHHRRSLSHSIPPRLSLDSTWSLTSLSINPVMISQVLSEYLDSFLSP